MILYIINILSDSHKHKVLNDDSNISLSKLYPRKENKNKNILKYLYWYSMCTMYTIIHVYPVWWPWFDKILAQIGEVFQVNISLK